MRSIHVYKCMIYYVLIELSRLSKCLVQFHNCVFFVGVSLNTSDSDSLQKIKTLLGIVFQEL